MAITDYFEYLCGTMEIDFELCRRILIACLLGAIIGYEREFRGKSAGVRTHLLVSMGSCLLMIISIYGFPETMKYDAARIAAGVVGGLGFLGGGIIMKNNHVVSGLTTAAGIWVTGAVGLGIGGGMYSLSILTAALMILTMEALHFYTFKYGNIICNVVLSSENQKDIEEVLLFLEKRVNSISIENKDGVCKASLSLLTKKKDYPRTVLSQLSSFPNVTVESLS